jgi:hypothetical protein
LQQLDISLHRQNREYSGVIVIGWHSIICIERVSAREYWGKYLNTAGWARRNPFGEEFLEYQFANSESKQGYPGAGHDRCKA